MPDHSTYVEILTLQDFSSTLTRRLGEVDAMLSKLSNDLGGAQPRLGRFQDAQSQAVTYTNLHTQYVDRLQRLRSAIVAAQRATNDIIANYTTTEARNHASAADIASRLAEVTIALGGRGSA